MSSADKCWECEKENVPLHNHHPVPRVRGGTKTIPLCEECHSKAHHRKKNMDTSKLTKEGLAKRKAQGAKLGNAPYGFTKKGNDRVVNPEEMKVVFRIKALREEGNTIRGIAAALDADGVKTRHNKSWGTTAIHNIVKRDYGASLEEDNET